MSSCDLTLFICFFVLLYVLQNQNLIQKFSEIIISGQAQTTNSLSRATDCTLQEIGEYAVSSEDIKHKYKSSLDECKTDCVNSPQCRAMYYINRRCFIIHKEAKRVERMGSSYFQKKCHGLYCDVKLLEGQLSNVLQIVSNLSSEVKSLKESLAKFNTTVN